MAREEKRSADSGVATVEDEDCPYRARNPFGANTTSSPLILPVCAFDLWSLGSVAGDPLPTW